MIFKLGKNISVKSPLERYDDMSIIRDRPRFFDQVGYLLKISIFSINNDLISLTKIMNNLVKDLKTLSIKVIFQCLKLVESFQEKNSVKNI